MNTEKQRIAIAEARGMIGPFENSEEWFENGDSDGCMIVLRDATGKRVPDYLNDLNAMHEAEEVLLGDQRIIFLDELLDVLGIKLGPGGWDMDLYSVYLMTRATAEQRAEAFLRTIGKWEDE